MMNPNAQNQMAHTYTAYYSSGDEGDPNALEGYSVQYVPVQTHAGHGQHQHHHQYTSMDMNQIPPNQMQQIQMQQYAAIQPHVSMQAPVQVQVAPVAVHQMGQNIYPHPSITSPPPPPSPYDPVSPAHSASDHSGSESIGPTTHNIRPAGVPIMPATRIYHHHSQSSGSSTSSLHGEHPYATPIVPYGNPNSAALRRHSRNRSIETTPPPGGHYAGSDEDELYRDTGGLPVNPANEYVNQISLLNRKESTRRQRIQAEQKRRDELRDGYSRLKDVLPITNSKSSKVSLIERARSHILDMDEENKSLKNEVEELRKEIARLQGLSEKMAMNMSIPVAGSVKSESNSSPSATAESTNATPAYTSVAPSALSRNHAAGEVESEEDEDDLYAQIIAESQDTTMGGGERTPH